MLRFRVRALLAMAIGTVTICQIGDITVCTLIIYYNIIAHLFVVENFESINNAKNWLKHHIQFKSHTSNTEGYCSGWHWFGIVRKLSQLGSVINLVIIIRSMGFFSIFEMKNANSALKSYLDK